MYFNESQKAITEATRKVETILFDSISFSWHLCFSYNINISFLTFPFSLSEGKLLPQPINSSNLRWYYLTPFIYVFAFQTGKLRSCMLVTCLFYVYDIFRKNQSCDLIYFKWCDYEVLLHWKHCLDKSMLRAIKTSL